MCDIISFHQKMTSNVSTTDIRDKRQTPRDKWLALRKAIQ